MCLTFAGTKECKDLNIDVKCNSRQSRSAHANVKEEKATSRSERVTREASDTYSVQISFPAIKYAAPIFSYYDIMHTFPLCSVSDLLFFSPFSDPVVNSNSNERSNVQRLLEHLILEEDQFDVHDILPNTVPDPASLTLTSDYACPLGQVVMAPDCGECSNNPAPL